MVIPLGLSDHYMVGCVRTLNLMKRKPRIIICQNYSLYCASSFIEEVENTSWEKVLSSKMLITQILTFHEQRRSRKGAPWRNCRSPLGKFGSLGTFIPVYSYVRYIFIVLLLIAAERVFLGGVHLPILFYTFFAEF